MVSWFWMPFFQLFSRFLSACSSVKQRFCPYYFHTGWYLYWCPLPNGPGCQSLYSNGPGSALGHTPNLLTREIIAIRLGVRIRRPQINGSIIVPSADRGSGTGLVPFNPLCFRCGNCVPVTAIALSAPCKGMFWSTVCSFFKVQQEQIPLLHIALD